MEKRYRSTTHGSRFIMPSGKDLYFPGGLYITGDPEEQAELDKVCGRPGSMIYADQARVVPSIPLEDPSSKDVIDETVAAAAITGNENLVKAAMSKLNK